MSLCFRKRILISSIQSAGKSKAQIRKAKLKKNWFVIIMALESLCGISPSVGFGKLCDSENDLKNFCEVYSGNLYNHTQLALPPFNDVS